MYQLKRVLTLFLCFAMLGGMAVYGEPAGSGSVAENPVVASTVDSSSATREVSSAESSNMGVSSISSFEISHTENSRPKSSFQTSSIEEEEKEHCSAAIEEAFSPDGFLVVYKHEYSVINKERTMDDFPGIDVESIEDLTKMEITEQNRHLINFDKFKQIFYVKLVDKTKQNVLNAIKVVEQYEEVDVATPNYYMELVD